MARIVKEEEYARKRNEILDIAQGLLLTKGYESMAIHDILTELKISSGAFYHYFGTKSTLLEALIERMQLESEKMLLPIVHDLHLTAQEKLRCYFAKIDNMKTEKKSFLLSMMHSWYSDDNAIVRQKVEEATIERRKPLLSLVVNQGIQEGAFAVSYPNQVAEVILSLSLSMENAFARLLLSSTLVLDVQNCIYNIVATHNAYMEAVERVLQAPLHFLNSLDAETVRKWLEDQDVKIN